MFPRTIERLLFFGLVLNVSSDSYPEIDRVKRSDIDIQTCIDNFNVHRDKIIRTQDSQNMGAKYLNEMDLGSRVECLRLCCETDECDVFVFEEKNSGSCYLFHCGPPEDFKCKFTHHVNYSSAVLSINRHLPDLESQIKLTKHEQDLSKLRKPEDPEDLGQGNQEAKTTPSTTTTTVVTKEIIPSIKIKESEEARKCSRFQFECRSTGECIAIYNACDGIPQCADGSDEAPELGCPDLITTVAPPSAIVNNNPPAPVRYDVNVQQPPVAQINSQVLSMYRPPIAREPPQLPQTISHSEADFIRPVSDPRNVNTRIQYDTQPIQPYVPQLPVQGQSNWIPHQSNQMPQTVPQYNDKNSHIFNHKENGLQVPDGQEIRYNKYKGAMQYLHRALGYSGGGGQLQYTENNINGRDYSKVPSYYGDNNYRQPIQQENWPPAEDVRYNDGQRYLPENNIPVQDPTNKDQNNYKPSGAIQVNSIKTDTENPKHVQEKLAHDLKHSKDNMEHGNTEHSKVKIEKHPHHEEYPDVVAYKIDDSSDFQDGFAHTPRGAVLSVTLGLIITFIMAIMIGCRVKMVRRRVRRGKSYAHDADYLVNGMYL